MIFNPFKVLVLSEQRRIEVCFGIVNKDFNDNDILPMDDLRQETEKYFIKLDKML